MFNNTRIPETAVATADTSPAPGPQTPTVTFYQKAVEEFDRGFDALIAALPDIGFTASHPATANFVRKHQNVSLAFLASAVATVEQSPSVQGTQAFDPVASRDILQLLEAFTPLAERLTAFRNTLVYTLMAKRAELTVQCLQVYAVSKGLARHVDASAGPISLATHVHTMKHNLGRKGARKKASPAPQTPAPSSQTPEAPEPRGNAAQA
jgi:hypothetical protein